MLSAGPGVVKFRCHHRELVVCFFVGIALHLIIVIIVTWCRICLLFPYCSSEDSFEEHADFAWRGGFTASLAYLVVPSLLLAGAVNIGIGRFWT